MSKRKRPTVRVVVILDESGSMIACRDQAVSGYNEYLAQIKKDHPAARVTFTTFHSKVVTHYVDRPAAEIQPITHEAYTPQQCTAMFDAIGLTLQKVEPLAGDAGTVLVCIISDGLENASQQFRASQITEMVKRLQETQRWTFTCLVANQDLTQLAADTGIPYSNMAAFRSDAAGTVAGITCMASRTSAYLGQVLAGGKVTYDFYTDSDRKVPSSAP